MAKVFFILCTLTFPPTKEIPTGSYTCDAAKPMSHEECIGKSKDKDLCVPAPPTQP